jgi:hypothetical protein
VFRGDGGHGGSFRAGIDLTSASRQYNRLAAAADRRTGFSTRPRQTYARRLSLAARPRLRRLIPLAGSWSLARIVALAGIVALAIFVVGFAPLAAAAETACRRTEAAAEPAKAPEAAWKSAWPVATGTTFTAVVVAILVAPLPTPLLARRPKARSAHVAQARPRPKAGAWPLPFQFVQLAEHLVELPLQAVDLVLRGQLRATRPAGKLPAAGRTASFWTARSGVRTSIGLIGPPGFFSVSLDKLLTCRLGLVGPDSRR